MNRDAQLLMSFRGSQRICSCVRLFAHELHVPFVNVFSPEVKKVGCPCIYRWTRRYSVYCIIRGTKGRVASRSDSRSFIHSSAISEMIMLETLEDVLDMTVGHIEEGKRGWAVHQTNMQIIL